MDRRAFITNALLSAGFLAATAGAASALPSLPSHDTLAPAGNVENAWWYVAGVLASAAVGMASATGGGATGPAGVAVAGDAPA